MCVCVYVCIKRVFVREEKSDPNFNYHQSMFASVAVLKIDSRHITITHHSMCAHTHTSTYIYMCVCARERLCVCVCVCVCDVCVMCA